ncbi:MAG: gamma-glutamyltransferase, partial [Planctomycetota bacterium]|nr:gamma-glutamyltransferase [Planctomycetota bacterium]
LIAESGTFAFYEGALAEAIAKTVEVGGGVLSRRDLRRYRPELRAPVVFESGKHTVYAAPPPSSGGVVIGQIFGVLEAAGVGALAHAGHLHTYIEASKHAFADRAKFLADPSSLDNIQSLLDREVFRARAANIQDLETFPPEHYGTAPTPNEDAGTSHLSVVDANGMAVSCTETINLSWGSCVCVEGFGFMLNDEMDDFTARPGEPNAFGLVQSEANAPQPGNRPLSSMSPTIVLRDGKAVALAGASGGPLIISATSQVLWHMLHGDDPGTAIRRPRIHHQWMPNIVRCEAEIDLTFFDMTTSIGHQTEAVEGRLGICQAIKVTESGVHAACDPGKGGRPAGG